MADVDIVVDSGDLKAAIDLLKDYGISFTKMVNQVQTEGNRLSRASKATASQVEQAWENAQKVLDNNRHEEAARKEQQILKRRGQNWKQFFQQDYMRSGSGGITKTSSLLIAQLEEDAAEEKRILNLRSQNWKQFFQQDFMRNTPASSMGAPTAKNSAFDDMERAAKEAAAATKELDREISALTAKYNPLLAAEQQYLAMKNQITRASDLGVIDIKQEAAALDQLEKEYQALSKGVYLAGSRFNQFGEQAGIAGKSANRFGMYAQQAGYQIGDFAVQLQSGTNFGVAFSQQFAQLAGLIPGVAGAITTFAAIGLGLAIQNMITFNKEGKKTGEIYSDLGSTLDSLEAIRLDSVSKEFSEYAKVAREEFEAILDVAEKIELKSLKATLDQPLEAVRKQFSKYEASSNISSQIGGGEIDADILGFKNIERAAQAYQLLADIQGESKEELAQSLEYQTRLIRGSGLMTPEVEKQLALMAEQLGIADRAVANAENLGKAHKNILSDLQQETEMRSLLLKYGEDSVQVRQAELDAEHAKTLAMIETLDIADELKLEIEAAAQANYDAESATIAWGNSLGYVKNQIAGIASILASIGGGMISNAEKFTTAKLIREGATRVEAEKQSRYRTEDARYEAQRQQNLSQYGKIIGTAINAGLSIQYEGGRNADEALLAAHELDAERSKSARGSGGGRKKGSGGGGRGGSGGGRSETEKDAERATEKLNDFFDQFKSNIEQQERLLGVYGEQREELEKVIEIENRLGDARHLVSQKQIEAMAQEELAIERKLQREQELYEIGSQNVENLLMSIVNGTSSIEDAFRTMLANIIREVYQNYVAKGAADVAGKFLVSLFSANGNAFGPSGVKMFAKGGVVDSPTLFNYSGGTGMMGEAGPEAIMPLKRNSQGKLGVQVSGGSSGNVSIQQNFHISANGDESVRTIIRQEMPNIASAAKAAVIEGKRRNERGL